MNLKQILLIALATLQLSMASMGAQTNAAEPDPAILFGAQQSVTRADLSPDGKRIVYIGPGAGTMNFAAVIDIAAGKRTPIAGANGQPMRLSSCGWSALIRLVCMERGVARTADNLVTSFSRLFAMDADGKNMLALGQNDSVYRLYGRQFDGNILDWMNGTDGVVMMGRHYVPEMSTGRRVAQVKEGYGVDLIDTRTLKETVVEHPRPNVWYLSDGRGVVRLMTRNEMSGGLLTGKVFHHYRAAGERDWRDLGEAGPDGSGIDPLAVDSAINAAYVLKALDGRAALYRISLDGSLKTELVYAHRQVDVDDVVTIGRNGRVIGVAYATDRPHVEYFDPVYKSLADGLKLALPQLPLITFVSASADEQVVLILASSDNHAGNYYLFDRNGNRLTRLMPVRPELEKVALSQVKAVSYPAADGTTVPAYLTLPPGVDKASGLPAIVLPHGGPASRDVWGFDWLAQYYANRGFAVLQPNFRGSAGFGDDWFAKNGFQSWKIAVGDVADGGRWLVSQGMADPNKLAIVGWSYGGYAALQANVLDSSLFKAVVAIAPVTDLNLFKQEAEGFTNARTVRAFIGSGPHLDEGSPAQHAEAFKAPVLLFHGDTDANVDVAESRAMDRALRRAGKSSELVVYPKLDHQLPDSAARADMLRRSYEFLRTSLKL
jgi:acetyl esterase/lipase